MRSAVLSIDNAVHARLVVNQFLNRAVAFETHIWRLERTLPHAVLEQTTALAESIDPEIAWLLHRAAERICLARETVDGVVLAEPDTHRAHCVEPIGKSGRSPFHHLLPAQQQRV